MKKISWQKLKSLGDKEFWLEFGSKFQQFLRNLPRTLFIRHGHLIDVLAVMMVLLFAGYLVAVLLYFHPLVETDGSVPRQGLSVDRIERLQGWMAVRAKERGRELRIPEGPFD